ncbi:class I SAM-dependent methyltransferase [Aneurinibacillus aneurinilyticus]|jgi:16S rRNA (guanine1207-N2)-methyltransferase|uniref:Class I SAM-dependent methyltransferase n=2 Tax=Aneurinibacillus aneurinilyticus TaxID=1391 RepID=A0A848CZT1_ANEAE|nr:class I SAM-dependent methyltransferase [Aneurinibacillus aneurinilyticus]ERI11011.1 methyltransferase small domain protein [Aneurinibacillus aneurinilyticus ATCC 12856]MED0673116.1 class I SAM-dependent methyltransferase [Aneurinibacillus aneurinilyticus]MED0705950.1 class I SAM-dependent methyltransferase [Aneurinibacillus aneurinilyticus]MED0721371.1 class I SAM-dependent methyltransferase [Aneurinibacillus aneurinilyticus]MED0734492.1 class I SAM-dependent methyltransferase [Aneurinibac
MEHYYTNQPGADSMEQTFTFDLRGREFRFITDRGVFSKNRIDFGSVLLIETMEIEDGMNVLDVGCGYGPIGMTAASLTPSGRVMMLDINERAVSLANRNLAVNGILNAEAIVSDRFSSVPPEQKFDVILTNPPIRAGKQIVHGIFEDAVNFLAPGGSLWIVIQKKQGAPSALVKLQELYSEVREVAKKKGYFIFQAINS